VSFSFTTTRTVSAGSTGELRRNLVLRSGPRSANVNEPSVSDVFVSRTLYLDAPDGFCSSVTGCFGVAVPVMVVSDPNFTGFGFADAVIAASADGANSSNMASASSPPGRSIGALKQTSRVALARFPCLDGRWTRLKGEIVQSRTRNARFGLPVAAAALVALVFAAPAGAASFNGDTIKLDLKQLTQKSVKATFTNAASKSKTAGTFTLGFGTATLNAQSSGNIPVEPTNASIKLKLGKKTVTLSQLTEKLAAGKGQLTAKVGGKGKQVAIFDEVTSGKLSVRAGFTGLNLAKSNLQLTKAGAGALNKGFGLKKPKAFKAKQKTGSTQFSAVRSLRVTGGQSSTTYDTAFYDKLQSCNIALSSIAPATAIPADAGHPRGGVILPIDSVNGGVLRADNLAGTILHTGGTALDSNNTPKGGPYHSQLTAFAFGTATNPPGLEAFSSDLNGRLVIGSVIGAQLTANLSDTGGTVTVSNGSLALSDAARAALFSFTGCDIAANERNIGATSTTANVQ
jgi:hypothetical protein